MSIFVLCCDAGGYVEMVEASHKPSWACTETFDQALSLAYTVTESGYFYSQFDYIYELEPGMIGWKTRWRYNREARMFDPWRGE